MQPSDFIHPEDAAALRQMESIPGFTAMVKNLGYWHREPAVWSKYGILYTAVRKTTAKVYAPVFNDIKNYHWEKCNSIQQNDKRYIH